MNGLACSLVVATSGHPRDCGGMAQNGWLVAILLVLGGLGPRTFLNWRASRTG